jgi:hypothetical protein
MGTWEDSAAASSYLSKLESLVQEARELGDAGMESFESAAAALGSNRLRSIYKSIE